jgi:hypothetical protein
MDTGSAAIAKTAQARVPVLLDPGAIDLKGWVSYSPVKSVIRQRPVREVPNEK